MHNSFFHSFDYFLCCLIALTHKKMALCLIVATQTSIDLQTGLQTIVLIATLIGALLRIYIDWKQRNKK